MQTNIVCKSKTIWERAAHSVYRMFSYILSYCNLSYFEGGTLVLIASDSAHAFLLLLTTNNNQRTNGPVNAHLISWPRISIWCSAIRSREPHIPSFVPLVKYIKQFPGQRLQNFPTNQSLSHFYIKA